MRLIKTQPKFLVPEISFFYSLKGIPTSAESVHRLPDGTLDLVINLGEATHQSSDNINFVQNEKIVLTGLYQSQNYVRYTGQVHLVGAVFKPGYARLFTNDSLKHFQQCSIDARFVFGNNIHSIADKLVLLKSETDKHILLENYLLEIIRKKSQPNQLSVDHAVQLIHVSKGTIHVADLSKETSMSERNFRRSFLESVGVSPKQYSRIVRAKELSRCLLQQKKTIDELAFDLNYNDASHLVKDFTQISGVNTTTFLKMANPGSKQYLDWG